MLFTKLYCFPACLTFLFIYKKILLFQVRMKCLSVVLVTFLSLVHCMPSETTTSRYNNEEQNHTTHNTHYLEHKISISPKRMAKQPTDSAFFNEVLLNSLKTTTFNKTSSRKIDITTNKYPVVLNSFIKSTVKDMSNKTLKINTVHKLPTNNLFTVKVPKISIISTTTQTSATNKPIKIITTTNKSLQTSPNKRKQNSTLILSTKNGITVKATTLPPSRIRIKKITTQNKLTTSRPTLKIKLTRFTTKKPATNLPQIRTTPRTVVKTRVTSRRKTPNRKIVKVTAKNETKQNWYDENLPIPTPNPEIFSNSPQFSISDVANSDELLNGDLSSFGVDAAEFPSSSSNPLSPISTFNLDMLPDQTKDAAGGSGCPTVHISSNVLGPQQRQDCSDLNLVINSHFHQNMATDRTPGISTYDAAGGGGGARRGCCIG